MKRFWIRWLVIVIVFFASIALFGVILNKGNTDMTIEMQEATLPVISIIYGGKNVNTMHGYVERMDNGTMRESISPVGEYRELSFQVDSFSTGVNRVAYEIRSLDGSRLIEDTVAGDYEHHKGRITGTINLKDLINRDEEYNLNFLLNLDDGREVYYYTRIICSDELEVLEKLDFIYDFNNKTFTDSSVKELSTYMEPNSDADNTSLGQVSIHNNIKQLGWGGLSPRLISDISATIIDISEKGISAKLEYIVSVMADSTTNYYMVEEDYVVRQGKDRFYLIDFNRNMSETIVAEKETLVNNKIVLGIQRNAPQMTESEDGNIVVLENCSRLYSYDLSANKFATLYAFYNAGDIDVRRTYNKSRIKVLSVEENGNVTFMVYGYMNRGIHEGQNGIVVEYYNSVLNTIEEQLFISNNRTPEMLMCDVDKLCYLNNKRNLFTLLDGNIIRVNLDSLETEVISDCVIEDTLKVSGSMRLAVWQESYEPTAELITLDMGDGFKSKVDKQSNECISPIGFMQDDLIYGISYDSEIIHNKIGDYTLLMDKIVIMSEYGAVLKEYTFDDIYIVEGRIKDNQIVLKRVRKNGDGSYTDIYDDQITYNEVKFSGKNKIKKVAIERFENIYQIEVKKNIDSKSLKFLTPKEVIFEGGKEVIVDRLANKERYILYARGHVSSIHDDLTKAIDLAFDQRGIVVDNQGNELYKRGDTAARNQIMSIKAESIPENKPSAAVCLDTMLKQQGISRNTEYMLAKGETLYQVLEDNMPNAYILNLTGCTMDTAFYYLDKDIPVLAMLGDGKSILLIGYNEQNMVWYDPDIREIYKQGINDSRDIFEAAGNRFLTYKPINTSE